MNKNDSFQSYVSDHKDFIASSMYLETLQQNVLNIFCIHESLTNDLFEFDKCYGH